MKHLLLVVALISSCFAAVPTWQFSGDLSYGGSYNRPTIYSGTPGSCTTSTSAYNFANVTITPNVTGPYLIQALSYDSPYVSIYTTFDPANPCNGALFLEQYGNNVYDNSVDYTDLSDYSGVIPLTAGTAYTLVVSSSSGSDDGFAIRIYAPDQMGSTATATTWTPVYDSSGCTVDSTTTAFTTFTWTANVTGTWDFIFAQYVNATHDTSASYIYGNIYNATLTAAQLTANPCNANWVTGDYASNSYNGFYITADVVAGTTYTIVVSGYDVNSVNYGFWQWKTPKYYQTASPLYTLPDRSLPCSASTTTGSWGSHVVTATGNRLIVRHLSSTDEEIYVYSGDNSGTAVTAPSTCPIVGTLVSYQDSESSYSTNTSVGQTYTVIVTPYFGDVSTDFYAVYAWTGVTIVGPNIVVSTTGAATTGVTGVATTGVTGVATTGVTGVATTGVTGNPTTGNNENSSPATQVVASALFVLSAIFALLF